MKSTLNGHVGICWNKFPNESSSLSTLLINLFTEINSILYILSYILSCLNYYTRFFSYLGFLRQDILLSPTKFSIAKIYDLVVKDVL